MTWKLWTRDEAVQPPSESYIERDSKDEALKAACACLYPRQPHIKILRIEGPNAENGERTEAAAIEAWCREH
jgi:hypothetical protein